MLTGTLQAALSTALWRTQRGGVRFLQLSQRKLAMSGGGCRSLIVTHTAPTLKVHKVESPLGWEFRIYQRLWLAGPPVPCALWVLSVSLSWLSAEQVTLSIRAPEVPRTCLKVKSPSNSDIWELNDTFKTIFPGQLSDTKEPRCQI